MVALFILHCKSDDKRETEDKLTDWWVVAYQET